MSARDDGRVLLAFLPFGHAIYPQIGMGLLQAGLREAGIPCDVRYFNLDFLERFVRGSAADAYAVYHELATLWEYYYPAEAIFSRVLFPEHERRARGAIAAAPPGRARDELVHLWDRGAEFLAHCLESVPWDRYRVVAFSSMFNQNLGTLALAAELERRHPHLSIVVGGANAEGVSGEALVRAFPQVDYVLSGDSDLTFPRLVRAILDEAPVPVLPGLVRRSASGVVRFPSAPVEDIDRLPTPSFDEFFEHVASGRLAGLEALDDRRRIPYETSRGCWWGEASHCTFCGLNGLGMAYRKKSEARILDEVGRLVERYRPSKVCCVDNILHPGFFTSLFPLMESRGLGVELSFEVKSNLKRRQVDAMRRAGMTEIQPGIESLSTRILGLMKKGATRLDNVRMLRLAQEHGMFTIWLHLYGFPGETLADYEDVVRLAPRLFHLQPPVDYDTRMTIRRFSPYFDRPAEFGVGNLRPAGALPDLYALPAGDVHDLAYRFDADYADGTGPESWGAIGGLLGRMRGRWRARYEDGADLSAFAGPTTALVLDLREEPPVAYRLDGLARDALIALDDILDRRSLERRLLEGAGPSPNPTGDDRVEDLSLRLSAMGIEPRCLEASSLDAALADLEEAGLVLAEGDRSLSLAIPRSPEVLEQRLGALEALAH